MLDPNQASASPNQPASNPAASQQPMQTPYPQGYGPQGYLPAPRRKTRWWVWVVAGLGAFCFFGMFATAMATFGSLDTDGAKVTEAYHSGNRQGTDKIAVLKLEGVIIEGEGYVKDQIDRIRKDKNVKAVVLAVNSPGGTVAGSDYMHHHLKEMLEERKIPVVVSIGAICASGGYYVSMAVGSQTTQENVIYAEPTAWTGSIGVLIPHYDLSGLAAQYHVVEDSIKSHELKAMGGMLKKMTEQERAILKGLVDEMFDRFKTIVKAGRPKLSEEKLTEVATGQVFSTKQAIAHGLVDQEGFIEDAIKRAAQLASLDPEKAKVVKYKSQPSLMQLLSGDAKAAAAAPANPFEAPLAVLREAASPRPFYMYSTFPAISVADFGAR